MDFVETAGDRLTLDVTANAGDVDHAQRIADAVDTLDTVVVHRVSDRTYLTHLKGKLEVRATVPLKTRDDLSLAYTPGVARVCRTLAERPEDARTLTIKGNAVAIVTDGSAVLGLGDIGATASIPVMEGKAALFKRFAGIDAWPVCLDTTDVDEIVRTVIALAPVYGGINLEDIAAPRCFEVERRLREALDIPVFHDDQHGTAIVVLAALINALRVVGKELGEVRVAMSGAGAAGVAIANLLLREGVGDLVLSDIHGVLSADEPRGVPVLDELAQRTNHGRMRGTLHDAIRGADVFIGVSAPNLLSVDDLTTMAEDRIVFALANPDPEVDPYRAREVAAVVATGRSDLPNQINNVLAFPGVFRGALDAKARHITEGMKAAAARALAAVVTDEELRANYIVPSVFNDRVVRAVADAVVDEVEGERAEGDEV
ncbi:MAG: NAD-dependent malic enzyme [Nitriliruptoraceae bacterium]|nr:NAD-dependent malic enzyme [Nitriliruptoraceae bacterium]